MNRVNPTDLLRVLIVDDNPEDRQMMREMLLKGSERSYQILEADTVSSALQICKSENGQLDCILVDYHLPDDNATELLKELGAPDTPSFPFVVVTGKLSHLKSSAVLWLGAQELIGKSWMNPESLTRAVEHAIERFAMIRELREADQLRATVRMKEKLAATVAKLEDLNDNVPSGDYGLGPDGTSLRINQTEQALLEANQQLNRQAESLSEAMQRLKLANDAANIGVWTWDFANDEMEWDERMCVWYDLREASGKTSHDFWRSRLHPDDVEQAEAKLMEALNNGTRYDDTFRIVLPDGLIRHIHAAAVIEQDTHGKPIRIIGINHDISGKINLLEKLRDSDQRYAYALEASRDGIWDWFVQTNQVVLSKPYFTLLGYEPYEFPQTVDTWYQMVHPDEREWVLVTERQKLESSQAFDLEYRMRTKEGRYKWMLSRGKVVEWDENSQALRVVGTITDITERKQLELELRNTNQELQAIFDSAGVGIALMHNRIILRCNRKLEELFGYDPGEMDWMPTRKWYVDEAAYDQLGAACYPAVERGETFVREQPVLKKDGSLFLSKLVARALDINDPGKGMLAILQDVTAEHEFNEALQIAKEKAEVAMRVKSSFLANMSHEIRTPMNAIIGFSSLVLDTELTAVQREYLSKLKMASKSLLSLINDILDYSKIESGHLHLESASFNLKEALRNATDMFSQKLKDKGLNLFVEVPQEVPNTLIGDSLRLGQVLNNLIANAVKFTHQGEIHILVELLPQQELQAGNVMLRFSISDTGIGIAAEMIQELFMPFTQADTSITRRFGGSGLGLSIAKSLVGLMGGEIWVTSRVGQGSVFLFTAQFQCLGSDVDSALSDSYSAVATLVKQQYSVLTAPIHGAEILLVEDILFNQLIATTFLERMGLNVTLAENGAEAVDWVRKKAFDVVLMDLQMPVLDGFAATRQIRDLPEGRSLIIIAMTASAMVEEKQACLDSGMNDHIAKPIDHELLASRLLAWIKPRQGSDNGQGQPHGDEPLLEQTEWLSVDESLLRPLLMELEQHLAQKLFAAKRVSDKIETLLLGTVLSDDFKAVSKLILQMRYKEALEALQVFVNCI
jgi:PAS domain S-box-containing protein